jgi:hypothetical protein
VDRGGTNVVRRGEVEVCTHGNEAAFASSATCAQGESFIINPAYRQGTMGQINEDFAVIHLATDLVSSSDVYGVSRLNPGVWEDRLARMVSYPGFAIQQSGCSVNSVSPDQSLSTSFDFTTGSGFALLAAEQSRQSVSSFGRTATKLRFKFDGSKGDSGAGIFYCPGDNCASNGFFVTSVFAKWNSVSNDYAGPRADVFRQFVCDAAK